jgi:lipoyl(octanoyl) transferase
MISVLKLGRIDYAAGLRVQQELIELRKAGRIGDVLLLLEHTPVVTLGRNAKSTHILLSPEALAARGVEVFECNRGGDVTFHGPGQLVGYPIFDLREHVSSQHSAISSQEKTGRKHLGAVDYVRRLEEVLIRTCADFSIATKRVAGLTGAWTEADPEAKIAAIGVHISRFVTSHGFALNVNTDLSFFNLIVPCGIASKPVTSMQKELGRETDMAAVMESVARNFSAVFASPFHRVESIDALLAPTVGTPLQTPTELQRLHKENQENRWV